jgi:transcriptional regulator with XRE-family HTH domain
MTEVKDVIGIGGRIRAARERLGLTREALAFHSGMSWSAIAQIESGRRTNLRPATLAALAGALGVTIDYMVSGQSPRAVMFEHSALLYEDDGEFLAAAAPFLTEAVDRSEPVLAITSRAKIDALRQQLGTAADNIQFADRDEWYDSPVRALARYHEFVAERVADGAPWVRILGEPVWEGRSAADVRVWCRYESLLNLVFRGSPVTLLCPYATRDLDAVILEQACATHPYTLEQDALIASPTYRHPDAYLLERPDA